jgi:hypothetical protein
MSYTALIHHLIHASLFKAGFVTAGACMMQIIKMRKKGPFTIPSKFRKKSNIKEAVK